MLLNEEQCRRKRHREEEEEQEEQEEQHETPLALPTDDQQQHRTKKGKKAHTPSYPPRFWDTLSRVPLSRRALQEFDRRTETARLALSAGTIKSSTRRLLKSDTRRLLHFASNGGPDLNALQGFSALPAVEASVSQSSTQSRKTDLASSTARSSGTRKTKTTMPYSAEVEQRLIDRGVFPDFYDFADGRRPPKPNNVQELRNALSRRRSSLSSTAFSEDAFEEFKDNNYRAKSEHAAMADVLSIIGGLNEKHHHSSGGNSFSHLRKFDPAISLPNPDRYYGARPEQVHSSVRRDLDVYIIPTRRPGLPAAPSFFFDSMSSVSGIVERRRAMYDGAVGARGIWHLQNYGNAVPVYDGNAYTIAVTYLDDVLKFFATHPRESETGGTEYYTTLLNGYYMKGDPEDFRKGAAAYRNAREWAQEQRDHIIANANAAALRMSADRVSVSQAEVTADASSIAAGGSFKSETSADELASDTHTVKRRRA